MSEESSSSEEEKLRLKEAIDPDFAKQNYHEKKECKPQGKCETHESLRKVQTSQSNNPFTVSVTPAFQAYVGKHLAKILDSIIEEITNTDKYKIKTKKSYDCIKLLTNSKHYLQPVKINECSRPRKYVKKKHVNNHQFLERAKEVAVSSEWVLSQIDTKYWESFKKGEIQIIKY